MVDLNMYNLILQHYWNISSTQPCMYSSHWPSHYYWSVMDIILSFSLICWNNFLWFFVIINLLQNFKVYWNFYHFFFFISISISLILHTFRLNCVHIFIFCNPGNPTCFFLFQLKFQSVNILLKKLIILLTSWLFYSCFFILNITLLVLVKIFLLVSTVFIVW